MTIKRSIVIARNITNRKKHINKFCAILLLINESSLVMLLY